MEKFIKKKKIRIVKFKNPVNLTDFAKFLVTAVVTRAILQIGKAPEVLYSTQVESWRPRDCWRRKKIHKAKLTLMIPG